MPEAPDWGAVQHIRPKAVTGVLGALKAGGLVPERPDLAIPLVVTVEVATIAVAWPGCAWIRCGRRQAPEA